MSDKERERLALRAIAVSTAAALQSMRTEPRAIDAIRDRADELLADLESKVIRDGADPTILAGIEVERRRVQR